VLADARYEERPIALEPGDLLVMYTDGASEAEAPSGEHFGTSRIEACMRRLGEGSARELLDGLVDAVREWTGERGLTDDLTLLVVKVKGGRSF
jgi:sigma-B regulation protein RsbU (phosphoserine phosphatase)